MTNKDKSYMYMVCDHLGITTEDYKLFRRRGATLHRLYEEQCNGYRDHQGNWSEELTNKSEAKEDRITKLIQKQAKELDLNVYLQTDPRGATVYLSKYKILDASNYNSLSSYCIY